MADETFGQMLMTVRSTLSQHRTLIERIEYALEAAHLADSAIGELTAKKEVLEDEVQGKKQELEDKRIELTEFEKARMAFIKLTEDRVNAALTALSIREAEAKAATTAAVELHKEKMLTLEEGFKDQETMLLAEIAKLTESRDVLKREIAEAQEWLKQFVTPR